MKSREELFLDMAMDYKKKYLNSYYCFYSFFNSKEKKVRFSIINIHITHLKIQI